MEKCSCADVDELVCRLREAVTVDVDEHDWKIELRVAGWNLLIYTGPDYSLITDFELTSPEGRRYLGSAGTPEMVRHLIDKDTGGDGDEGPFWMSDLILLDNLSNDSLVAAVHELIERGDVPRALDLAALDSAEEVE